MPTFKWLPSFEIGHEKIDRQHRELFDDLAAVDDELRAGRFEAANTKCRTMRNRLENHFKYEERLLMDHDFLRIAEHIKGHAATLRKIEGIFAECCENCEIGLELGCGASFYSILSGVEMIADLDFKSHLQERGVIPNR